MEQQNLPATIDRYQLRGKLGEGAYSSVYAAWDPKLGREVAIKILAPQHAKEHKIRERFLREAKAIASVSHPNVVQIYDYSGPASPLLYLVIEKYNGGDLYSILQEYGPLPESLVASIGYELCQALHAAHQQGVIHRDLKPENVILTTAGQLILTDFGIVKAIASHNAVQALDERTEVIGTPGFMAPELLRGRPLTPAIDLFSLGVVLYNLATNSMPFTGNTPLDIFRVASHGVYQDPREQSPLLSQDFCDVIAWCLQPQAKKRPQNAWVVKQALATVLDLDGVKDSRDMLEYFVAAPQKIAAKAHQKAMKQVLQLFKIACTAKRRTQASAYLQRLKILSQSLAINEAVQQELAPFLQMMALTWPQRSVQSLQIAKKWYSLRLLVTLAGLCLTSWLLVGWWWPPLPNQRLPVVIPAETMTGRLQVQSLNHAAVNLWVDGKAYGMIKRQVLKLRVGSHRLDLRQRHRHLQLHINTVADQGLLILANFPGHRTVVLPQS